MQQSAANALIKRSSCERCFKSVFNNLRLFRNDEMKSLPNAKSELDWENYYDHDAVFFMNNLGL